MTMSRSAIRPSHLTTVCMLLASASPVLSGISTTSVSERCTGMLLPALTLLKVDVSCRNFADDLQPFCCGRTRETRNEEPHPSCFPKPWRNLACQAGFFDWGEYGPYPCPNGAYCPVNQVCFIGCPVGAYCEQSTTITNGESWTPWPFNSSSVDANTTVQASSLLDDVLADELNANTTCSHSGRRRLAYIDQNGEAVVRCGGPFTSNETQFVEIQCPEGSYCPNTTTRLTCPSGTFCRAGTTAPQSCTFLTDCPEGSVVPTTRGEIGLIIAVILATQILILYFLAQRTLLLKLIASAKMKLMGNMRSTPTLDLFVARQVQLVVFDQWVESNNPSAETSTCQLETVADDALMLSVSFDSLSLQLKTNKKTVLSGASGFLQAGTATAIIGESGSGKTSLLNALVDRAYYAKQTGHIFINGRPGTLRDYRSVVGFVPQDDIMHRDLTVREVLFFQAMLRLPKTVTRAQAKEKVQATIDVLGKQISFR